jgi:hypothetical protein
MSIFPSVASHRGFGALRTFGIAALAIVAGLYAVMLVMTTFYMLATRY